MVLTMTVIFSTSFSLLMYFGFVKIFRNKKVCEMVQSQNGWQWLQPNHICTIRMIMAVLAYFLFFYFDWLIVGIFLFTIAATLDGVDGLVARATGIITRFGEWYDPFCDKVTYIPPILSFVGVGVISVDFFWVYLFLFSEFFGQFIVRKIQKILSCSVAANVFGKIKAVLCFVLIIYSAILMDDLKIHNFAGELFKIATVLSVISAVSKIIPKNIWKYFIMAINFCCGVIGVYYIFHLEKEVFLYSVAASLFFVFIFSVAIVYDFKKFFKSFLRKIPITIYILSASFILFMLAFSLKIGDELISGSCMIFVSSFFIILNRLRIV